MNNSIGVGIYWNKTTLAQVEKYLKFTRSYSLKMGLTLEVTGVHSDLQAEYWTERPWFFRPFASMSDQRSVCFRNRTAWGREDTS